MTQEIVTVIIGGVTIFITLGSGFLRLRDEIITLKERSINNQNAIAELKADHKSHTEELKELFGNLSKQIHELGIKLEQNKK